MGASSTGAPNGPACVRVTAWTSPARAFDQMTIAPPSARTAAAGAVSDEVGGLADACGPPEAGARRALGDEQVVAAHERQQRVPARPDREAERRAAAQRPELDRRAERRARGRDRGPQLARLPATGCSDQATTASPAAVTPAVTRTWSPARLDVVVSVCTAPNPAPGSRRTALMIVRRCSSRAANATSASPRWEMSTASGLP